MVAVLGTNETKEALEQQTASTEVLRVISSSVEDKRNIRVLIIISVLLGIAFGSYQLNRYLESIVLKKGDDQKNYQDIYDYSKKEWKTQTWQAIYYLNLLMS